MRIHIDLKDKLRVWQIKKPSSKNAEKAIENRTRRIHSNATEEEIQKLIQGAKDFKPSDGVEWVKLG